MPRASSLAAELKDRFNVESELVELSGGVFEVYLDDENIFSKKSLDRFPNDGEIAGLLEGNIA